ncbi:MAG: hypothetical protein K6A80_08020 [Saccharofermentans sp.]|nr:hypothetical protein [Saccharofermentans sp.]
MSNSEHSKQKILLIYEYFLHNVDPGKDIGVSVSELIDMLEDRLGERFERKSIYADIKKINEFASAAGVTGPAEDLIFFDGRKYNRVQLKDEILLDDAKMISDSLRTTEFVPKETCEKFEKMFPAYFNPSPLQNQVRLYTRYKDITKSDKLVNRVLTTIRLAIETAAPMRIKYGYKVTNSVVGNEYVISPVVLDWTNNHYYVIAIDHMRLFRKGGDESDDVLKECLIRYRLDRFDGDFSIIGENDIRKGTDYIKRKLPDIREKIFGDKEKFSEKDKETAREFLSYKCFSSMQVKDEIIDDYIKGSYAAYGSPDKQAETIFIRLEAIDKDDPNARKHVLRAFSVFRDEFSTVSGISEKSDSEIRFRICTPDNEPLYKVLFSIYTFPNVTMIIENEKVRDKLAGYLKKAAESVGIK